MDTGKLIIILMLTLGGIWCAAKLLGVVWYVIGPPVRAFADYFFVITSISDDVPENNQRRAEQRSYAVEQGAEQVGTGSMEHVPSLVEQLEQLSDDALLDILARVQDEDGEARFAESRIGRFIGGRLEDRIAEVRKVRGVLPPPAPPERVLRVRDNGLERLIAR